MAVVFASSAVVNMVNYMVAPMYHYILFNIDFDDKIFRFRTDGYNTYTSSRFAKVWKYGMHLIGEFSFMKLVNNSR